MTLIEFTWKLNSSLEWSEPWITILPLACCSDCHMSLLQKSTGAEGYCSPAVDFSPAKIRRPQEMNKCGAPTMLNLSVLIQLLPVVLKWSEDSSHSYLSSIGDTGISGLDFQYIVQTEKGCCCAGRKQH